MTIERIQETIKWDESVLALQAALSCHFSTVKGEMLCNDYYSDHPLERIDIIVEAFNALYNIDYSDCIIDETLDTKIKDIQERSGRPMCFGESSII